MEQKQTVDPEQISPEHLTNLSKKYLNWKSGLTFGIAVIMVITILNVLVSNPTISGYAVANEGEGSRVAGMSVLLVVIFAIFGLFLYVVTRKMPVNR
jgi:ABC-type uncharacterized transport system fused permease/ATPase subunit